MNRLALLATASAVLVSGSVLAADLPARKTAPAPAVAPSFTWSGFYVGLNAGYGGDSFAYPIGITSPGGVLPGGTGGTVGLNLDLNSSGPLGGAQVGYNYQVGSLVVGAEADFAFANIQGKLNASANANSNSNIGPQLGLGASIGSQIQNLGTVRLRVGYAWERALFYATGGWAYGNVQTSVSGGIAALGQGAGFDFSKSNMQNGWTLGAGVEYAFTDNITFKTEYLYADLGNATVYSRTYAAFNNLAVNWGVEAKAQIVRVGLNYKF